MLSSIFTAGPLLDQIYFRGELEQKLRWVPEFERVFDLVSNEVGGRVWASTPEGRSFATYVVGQPASATHATIVELVVCWITWFGREAPGDVAAFHGGAVGMAAEQFGLPA